MTQQRVSPISVTSVLPALPVLSLQAASGQSANIQEWKNSSGTVLARVDAFGSLVVGTAYIGTTSTYIQSGNSGGTRFNAGTATVIPLQVAGAASQTGDLQQWQNSAGSVLTNITAAGYLNFNSASLARISNATSTTMEWQPGQGWRFFPYGSSNVPISVRGAASQTGNLQEWQISDGTVVLSVSPSGNLAVNSSAPLTNSQSNASTASILTKSKTNPGLVLKSSPELTATITNVSGSGTVVTYTANNSFSTNQYVNITGVNPSAYNLTNAFIVSASATQFTVNNSATGAYVSGGTATTVGQTSTNPIFEIQNAAGTSIFNIDTAANNATATGFSFAANYFTSTNRAYGIFVTSNTTAAFNSSTTVPQFIVNGNASQTADMQQWKNSAGTVQSRVAANGDMYANAMYAYYMRAGTQSFIDGAALRVHGYGSAALSVFKGLANTTYNTQEWQESGGTILGGINPVGQIWTGATAPLSTTRGGATTAASGDGTTATITLTSAHYLLAGDIVTVAGVTPTGYNGTYVLTAVTSNTISYANTTTGAQTVAGTVSAPAQASINIRSGGTTGLIIRGATNQSSLLQEWQGQDTFVRTFVDGVGRMGVRWSDAGGAASLAVSNYGSTTTTPLVVRGAASQTATLTEWQNSAGTVLAKVQADGNIYGHSNFLIAARYFTNSANTGAYIDYSGSADSLFIAQRTTTAPNLIVRAMVSQTADIQQWQEPTGFPVVRVGSTGNITLGNSNVSADTYLSFVKAGSAKYAGIQFSNTHDLVAFTSDSVLRLIYNNAASSFVVKGAASQTANMFEIQDSSNNVLFLVGASAQIRMPATGTFGVVGGGGSQIRFQSNSTYVTTNSAGNIGLVVQGAASQTANLQEWQNSAGGAMVIITAGGNISGNRASFNGDNGAMLNVTSNNTTTQGIKVRAAGSQTANMQEWQDNAGTVLSSVSALGAFLAPAATTSTPSIRLPHGTAPTSPTDGDVWTTSAGIYIRINGTTVGPLGTGGGGGGAAGDSDQTILPVQIFS